MRIMRMVGDFDPPNHEDKFDTLQGTNISPKNGILKMMFLFPRWDMLIPWRVIHTIGSFSVFPVGEFFKSPDLAGHLWWQPHDFVNFLRTRLDIAEAYKAAAQSLGVDALSYLTDGKYELKGWNSNEDE